AGVSLAKREAVVDVERVDGGPVGQRRARGGGPATILPQERIAAAQTGRGKVVDDARRIGRPAATPGTERVEEAACRLRLHRGREVLPVSGVNEGCDIHRFTLAAGQRQTGMSAPLKKVVLWWGRHSCLPIGEQRSNFQNAAGTSRETASL